MNKICTDIEQSKKLAEFLPLESADMYYFLDPTPAGNIYHLTVQRVDVGVKNLPQYDEGDIPCWSLTALLSLLPKGTNISTPKPVNELSYCCWNQYNEIYASNPVDAAFEMVCWLKENKKL